MNFKLIPVIGLAALSLLSACDKKEDDNTKPIDPVVTPTETTTFKAVIDGTNWQAVNRNTVASGGITGIYGEDNTGKQLIISTSEINRTGTYTSGSLSYSLMHTDGSTSRWSGFLTDSTVNKLTITSFDPATKKISGTFSFTGTKVFGATTEPNTVTVTNGVFTAIKLP